MPRQEAPLSLEYILLGFLDQKPIHGYDLYKQISSFDAVSLVWTIKQSQLYALMDRLEEKGLITSTIIPGDSHPNRKQFQITKIGRQTFYDWRSSPVQHSRNIRIEFLAKIHFALLSSPEIVLELIGEQESVCYQWVNEFQNQINNSKPDQIYERIVFDYRLQQAKGDISWLENTRKAIDNQSQSILDKEYLQETQE